MSSKLHPRALEDFVALHLGKRLGKGIARHVYEYVGPFEDEERPLVAKVEYGEHDWQNVAEWTLWVNAGEFLQQYLAPCFYISPGGLVLIAARCEPCPTHLIPTKMPTVLRDLHDQNFGIWEGRPVVMDYGRHIAAKIAANVKTMRGRDQADTPTE